jgi:hypothetical protein
MYQPGAAPAKAHISQKDALKGETGRLPEKACTPALEDF